MLNATTVRNKAIYLSMIYKMFMRIIKLFINTHYHRITILNVFEYLRYLILNSYDCQITKTTERFKRTEPTDEFRGVQGEGHSPGG